MHLVDAIRRATQLGQFDATPNEPPQVAATNVPELDPNTTEDTVMEAKEPLHEKASTPRTQYEPPISGASPVHEPHDVSSHVIAAGGSVVRLELFLSPEQMHMMLRGIMQGAHTVMTLREASQFLRMPMQALIALAESGEVPAFMVEGVWKFPRQALEEWITLQTLQREVEEEDENAA